MNSKILRIFLAGAVLLATACLFLSTWPKMGDAHSQERSPEQEVSHSPPSGSLSVSAEMLPTAVLRTSKHNSGDPFLVEWVTQRSAGITFNQAHAGKLWYPGTGTLTLEDVTFELGETPPLFHYQLKAKNCALLIGELDSRREFQRDLRTLSMVDDKPEMHFGFTVTYPIRVSSPGGIVFLRNESVIQTVGIIIPDIKVPPGLDASSPEWSVSIRMNREGRYLDPTEIKKIQPQPLDSTMLVLMQTYPEEQPSSVRILWLKFDDNGLLVISSR